MTCCQKDCLKEATYMFTWPCQPSKPICTRHALQAQGLAETLGFELELRRIDDEAAKVVFALGPDPEAPVVALGISEDSWDYMRDGKTHHFDLRKLGIPVRIILFGGETQEKIIAMLQKGLVEQGIKFEDKRGEDFGLDV